MDIIALILVALGYLTTPDRYTTEYKATHQPEVAKAQTIYTNHQYILKDGVIIVVGTNP